MFATYDNLCNSRDFYPRYIEIHGNSNYIHYKVWNEITYPFPTLTVVPLEFGKRKIILSHT